MAPAPAPEPSREPRPESNDERASLRSATEIDAEKPNTPRVGVELVLEEVIVERGVADTPPVEKVIVERGRAGLDLVLEDQAEEVIVERGVADTPPVTPPLTPPPTPPPMPLPGPETPTKRARQPPERGRWSAGHYATLGTLFAASGCGMLGCGPGTMSLAVFGMSKDASLGFVAGSASSMLALGRSISLLLAVGSAGFSFGKLVGGPLADALGGKLTLVAVLTAMGGGQLLMSLTPSLGPLMCAAWFLTRGAHALTWCGVMLEARPWFLENGQETALSFLTASCPSGAFAGAVLGGRLLSRSGWRGVARTTGIVTLAVAALQLVALRPPPQPPADDDSPTVEWPVSPRRRRRAKRRRTMEALGVIIRSRKLWACYAASALITPTLDLPTLLPLYLDTLGADEVRIGLLGSLFSLAAVPAVLGGGFVHQRMRPKQRSLLYAPLLCVSAAGLLLLSTVRQGGRLAALAVAPSLVVIMGGISPSFYIPT